MKLTTIRTFIGHLLGIGMSSCLLTVVHAQDAAPCLQVAPNGRYLQWSDGTPFFIQSDTAWTLSRDYSREEVAKYLENRRALQFNTIQLSAVFFANPGTGALIGKVFTDGDFAKPVTAYWDKVDWTVKEATGRWLVVALNPIWMNQLNKTIKRNGVEKCRQFGRRFARRCRDNPGARD